MIATFTIAFFTFLRCCEFTVNSNLPEEVTLCEENVVVISSHKVLINLRKSKKDTFRKGISQHVHATQIEVCPVAAMHQYLCTAKTSVSKALFIMKGCTRLTRLEWSAPRSTCHLSAPCQNF